MDLSRYTTPEADALWSRQSQFNRLAAATGLTAYITGYELGLGPTLGQAAQKVVDALGPTDENLARWAALERRYDHDIAAFVELFREQISGLDGEWSDLARYLHLRRTSSDIADTVLAMTLIDFDNMLIERFQAFILELVGRALEHKTTHVLARTHGQTAEPTTVGRKLLSHATTLASLRPTRYDWAKLSGPIGVNHGPAVGVGSVRAEAFMLEKMGLQITWGSTQIVPRAYLARWCGDVTAFVSALSTFATELRLGSTHGWCREGLRTADHKGSSAMPTKRNPIRSERTVGLCKVIRHNLNAVVDAGTDLWAERDISHSSVERTSLQLATTLLDFLLADMTRVVADLEIDTAAAFRGTQATTSAAALEYLVVHQKRGYEEAYNLIRLHSPSNALRYAGVDPDTAIRLYDPEWESELWDSAQRSYDGGMAERRASKAMSN